MYLQIGQYRQNDHSRTDVRGDHASREVLLGEHWEFRGQLGHHCENTLQMQIQC